MHKRTALYKPRLAAQAAHLREMLHMCSHTVLVHAYTSAALGEGHPAGKRKKK